MIKISIFTDCRDSNVRARQEIRYSSLVPEGVATCYGVTVDIEATGCIVDALDAGRETPQIIVGNVARRENKKYKNGSPFSYVKIGNAIIIGTPTIFPLLAKLGLATEVYETDVYTVCSKFLDETEARRIADSQFRSFEYLPLLAKWLHEGQEIPAETVTIELPSDNQIWFVDNFGNCKTTVLDRSELSESQQALPFYERLSFVPVGENAIVRGSSGYKDTRFLEITTQGESTANKFGYKVGDLV
jgi:hypothetical protein